VLASSVHCEVRFDGNNSLILFRQSPSRDNKHDELVMPVGEAWIFSGNITRLRNEINKYFEEQ
jgi:hypothetical protein